MEKEAYIAVDKWIVCGKHEKNRRFMKGLKDLAQFSTNPQKSGKVIHKRNNLGRLKMT
ncbi:MAG: hypothetical protein RBR75_06335 [Acholeplasmataceae bacterium]|nr:hypothetical protein [Acholeplasmataceae bacterium]